MVMVQKSGEPVEVGSLSVYPVIYKGITHPRRLFGISSIGGIDAKDMIHIHPQMPDERNHGYS